MKLSNKILIGFFVFIFLYLTAVFAEIRLRGIPNIINDSNSIAETVDIPRLRYLVLRDLNKDVSIVGSDHSRLEIRSMSGDLLQRLTYSISGDTLTLSQLESDDNEPNKVSVFVPKSGLEGITVDSAFAIVKGLEQKLLAVSQNGGRIWISDTRIEKIDFVASGNAQLDISASEVDTLSARIETSQVTISSPLKFLEGSMIDNSFLRVHDIDAIEFKKDETSRFNLYE